MRRLAALCLLVAPLAGCSGPPLGYLDATSPVAGAIARLGWGLTVISVGVCLIVGLLLIIAIYRRRPDGDLSVTPVNDRTPIRWIGVGVAISTVFLLGYFVTSPIFGMLGDRLSRKRLITLGVLTWSAATVASGLSNSL